ncbi:DoxX family protein [Paenibacillus gansuensis]|uniref:DoxX family protein n=1 Tax=Paenibacillus gansuensis TaxID=306542 RepID=A0ABW5P923_9BACL
MHIVSIVLQVLLGAAFLLFASGKLTGQQMQVDNFNHLRLPPWFRIVTGLVHVVGAAGMIAGIWVEGLASWAGLWIGVTMLFAVIFHLRVGDSFGKALPALVLAVLAFAVTVINGF